MESRYGDANGRMSMWWRKDAGPTPYNSSRWYSYPSEIDKLLSDIEAMADKDVCITTSLYDMDKRTPDHATVTNSVWMDSDTCEGDNYRVEPTWTVQTSAGRWQHHWDLVETVPTSVASEISHRMAIAHADQGADPSSFPANKIMRVPGTSNTGHGFAEVVKGATNGALYTAEELLEAYGDIELPAAQRSSAPRKPQAPVEAPDTLPDYGTALEKISARTMELALAEPTAGQDRSRLRYKLLLELNREFLTFDEVLTIAWHAPAARKWSQDDARGLAGLVMEARKAEAEVQYETGQAIEPIKPEEDEAFVVPEGERVKLLTDAERFRVSQIIHFVKRYAALAGDRVPKQNLPYDLINGWTILSAAMSDCGYIGRKNGKEPLNLYTMTIGDTTTGKSQARKFMMTVLREFFGQDSGFNIGGNTSPSALGDKLIERDGKVSFFNKDEAHGAIKTWTGQDWTTGLLEDLAELYDGVVPPQLRKGNKETSGKSATTYFLMHLMGTPKAMLEAMDKDLFGTGFLARFQWAIGEPRELSYDSMAEKDAAEDDAHVAYDPTGRQVAAELLTMKRKVQEDAGTYRVRITINTDAAKRLQDAKWELSRMFEKDPNWEILEPSLVRMGVTLRKCASLVAMSDGRATIEMDDVLVALEAAEDWITNLTVVAGKISASDWQRACDDIEEFVREKGGSIKRELVIRKFKHVELRFVQGYLDSLYAQGRLREIDGGGTSRAKYVELNIKKEDK